MDTFSWLVLALVVLVGLGWYLSYTAARLDRLHARAHGTLAALDAQLVRRAEATLELANSSALDPASSLLLATAASEALDAPDGWTSARAAAESDLSRVLQLALEHASHDPEPGSPVPEPTGAPALVLDPETVERLTRACHRVTLARRFHNDAVTDVRRVRRKRAVRWFRLAGRAAMPQTVEFDDEVPALERGP